MITNHVRPRKPFSSKAGFTDPAASKEKEMKEKPARAYTVNTCPHRVQETAVFLYRT